MSTSGPVCKYELLSNSWGCEKTVEEGRGNRKTGKQEREKSEKSEKSEKKWKKKKSEKREKEKVHEPT